MPAGRPMSHVTYPDNTSECRLLNNYENYRIIRVVRIMKAFVMVLMVLATMVGMGRT